ncbi:chemotaxis protein CheB [Pseudomonas sp. LS-2]|jgi:two-component system chemotaxis response regulator CheB|uniref:chemotaxis protein CheB n=1 Tax=Pseudomonas sp. LS-2 TaxID=2315859 RepID=UPI000E74FF43|nr:chemotaxis protein CheB [Pseudomonas sp. LS-2]RJX79033.1 chemotaxis protein CheB [Pseudomonas sp. LS-2]
MDINKTQTIRDVIVIGGSQGSLEVLRGLLGGLPSDFPASILIVVHTGPSSPGNMAPILDRYSTLPVSYAKHGELVEAGKVYLALADRHLEVVNPGLIYLSDGPKVRFSRPAADRLFVTAAEVFGSRVISLILSGGDCDGADGANAVVAAGGLSLVQEPHDAMIPSMPIHAIKKDHPSARVKIQDMADVLIDAVRGV